MLPTVAASEGGGAANSTPSIFAFAFDCGRHEITYILNILRHLLQVNLNGLATRSGLDCRVELQRNMCGTISRNYRIRTGMNLNLTGTMR